ncbi:MAG: hypothetical protein MJA84_01830 [Firmicutes bacterium]|nr:hypothetical protein [Bacillota bacterium]
MNAWFNLFKKEYRMVRTSFLVMLVMLIIGGLWVMYANWHHLGIVLAPASLLFMSALFYPVFYMLAGVYNELRKTPHLWLHCPQPAWMLLSAKLVMALVVMLAMLLVGASFIYLILFSVSELTGIAVKTLALLVTEVGFYLAVAITGVSIYMAAWSSLIAVVTAGARHWLGRYNWLAGIATFIAATWGLGQFYQTWFFAKLTQWGAFNIKPATINQVLPANYSFGGLDIYAGQILVFAGITAAVFALCCWLIDNKVEV